MSEWKRWRYSAAMAATRTTASGSSAFTWKIGMGRRLAMSVEKREEFDSSGRAVKPRRLLTMTCMVPPTL